MAVTTIAIFKDTIGILNRWADKVPLRDTPGLNLYTQFGSVHPAAWQVVMCDGSVRSFSYDIDLIRSQTFSKSLGWPTDSRFGSLRLPMYSQSRSNRRACVIGIWLVLGLISAHRRLLRRAGAREATENQSSSAAAAGDGAIRHEPRWQIEPGRTREVSRHFDQFRWL